MSEIRTDRRDAATAAPPSRIRIVIATHAQVYAQGLGELVRAQPALDVAGVVITRVALLALIEQSAPDVVLIDFAMRDAADTARALARNVRGMRVVGFNIGTDDADICVAATAGLSGYVLRDAPLHELVATVIGAMSNLLVCSPRVAAILNARLTALTNPDAVQSAALTPRELEVAQLIDQGHSNKQIARRLGLRVSTVKNHVHSILEKLSADRRGQVATLFNEPVNDRASHTESLPGEARDVMSALTPRERQIAVMIDRAMSNQEIAERLNLRVSTVKNHVHSILEKLRVERRQQAAAMLRQTTRPSRSQAVRV